MESIFHVKGKDQRTGEDRGFFVLAGSEEIARAFASKRGVEVTEVERTRGMDMPEGVPVLRARDETTRRREGESALLERPVITIALGVFLGLVMFAIAARIFGFMWSI